MSRTVNYHCHLTPNLLIESILLKFRTNLLVSLPKDLGAAPPTFTKTIQSLNGVMGELSRFDAIVVGVKPLEVWWEKNGQRLNADLSCKMLNEGNQYTLLLLETNTNDIGSYQCVAKNQFGECRCEAQLNLVQKGQVRTQKATDPQSAKDKAPCIVEHLVNCVAKEGSSVQFRAKISNVKGKRITGFRV